MNYNLLDNFSYSGLVLVKNVNKSIRDISVCFLPVSFSYAILDNQEIGAFLFVTNFLLTGSSMSMVKAATEKIDERNACKYSLVKRHRMR